MLTNRGSLLGVLTRTASGSWSPFTGSSFGDKTRSTGPLSVLLGPGALASSHHPTNPTASSQVSHSQSPSLATTMKSPDWILVVVTSGSAVRYGGVFTVGGGGYVRRASDSRFCRPKSHLNMPFPKARDMPQPSTRPLSTTASPGCWARRRASSAGFKPFWSTESSRTS